MGDRVRNVRRGIPRKQISTEQVTGDFADGAQSPLITAVYPEYLTDLSLLVCPSDMDSVDDLQDEDGEFIVQFPASEDGKMGRAGISYHYLTGHVYDKIDDSDPTATISDYDVLVMFTPPELQATVGPLQLFEAWAIFQEGLIEGIGTPELFRVLDSDITMQTPGAGNGGSNCVMRLRDGVARFLITDINNPGASSSAESEIFVYYDSLAVGIVEDFNHAPGGSNVLYMDGHVEFIRYPGPAPLSKGLARLQTITQF